MFGSPYRLIRRQGYCLDYVVVALRKKLARLLLPKLFENDFIEWNMAGVEAAGRMMSGLVTGRL
jgi:hypothetical protein